MTYTNYSRNEEKNQSLIEERWIGFDDVLECIASWWLLDIVPHHLPEKYPNQSQFIISHNEYIYYIPFVIDEKNNIFLKTIIPSRKYNKIYIN